MLSDSETGRVSFWQGCAFCRPLWQSTHVSQAPRLAGKNVEIETWLSCLGLLTYCWCFIPGLEGLFHHQRNVESETFAAFWVQCPRRSQYLTKYWLILLININITPAQWTRLNLQLLLLVFCAVTPWDPNSSWNCRCPRICFWGFGGWVLFFQAGTKCGYSFSLIYYLQYEVKLHSFTCQSLLRNTTSVAISKFFICHKFP